MGRSKKNWDHLVDFYGNYGIDIINGIYPGSGNTPGVKGNKGDFGNKGQKGEDGSGAKGTKGLKGEPGRDGSKGDEGAKGNQGDAAQLLNFQGSVNTPGNLPMIGALGDVYYVVSEDIFYVYDGADWIPLSVDAAKGEPGEDGGDGQKGEPGADGNTGAGGDKGEPGEKGEDFDPLILDDYLDKGQVEGLIQYFHPPEYAFHPQFYSDPTSVIEGPDTADFQNTDQLDPLWNPGVVTISQSAVILNSPIPIDRLVVINYVVEDAGKLRGLDYTVVQHVMSASAANTDQDAYFRYARPARSIFGEWKKSHFDEDNYYDKPEVDDLIADRLAKINVEDGPQDNQVDLQQKNISTDQVLSFARFEGAGAITVTSAPGNKIIIDTPALNPLTFMGLIDLNEDPNVKLGAIPPARGMYFIFTGAGLYTFTGDTVAVGDWLIYNEETTAWEVISYAGSYGVAEVTLTPDGYLEDRGSSPAYPQIGIEMSRWKQEQASLDSNSWFEEYDEVSTSEDVLLPKVGNFTESIEYDKRVYSIADLDGSAEPNPGGRFFVDLGENLVHFERFDKNSFDLNGGFWTAATANASFIELDAGGVDTEGRVIFTGQYTLQTHPSLIAKMAKVGSFRITPFEKYGPDDQDALIYDDTANKWVNGDPAAGKYLSLKGGEVDGDVTIKGELNIEGNIHMKGGTIDGIPDPVKGDDVVSKEWVLAQIGGVQSVPPGLICFWASSDTVPAGWYKLDGSNYNVAQNPNMNRVVQNMHNARAGKLPDWSGHFVHQREGNETYPKNGGRPGQKVSQSSAGPQGGFSITGNGAHKHEWVRKMGSGAGTSTGSYVIRPVGSEAENNTSKVTYYTAEGVNNDGRHTHDLEGGDPMTRPNSVNGYWIIKGG
jgi:hypothetical protein